MTEVLDWFQALSPLVQIVIVVCVCGVAEGVISAIWGR